jgi:hypothetical protein
MRNPSLSFNSGRLKINAAIKRTNVKGIIVFRQKVAQSGYRVVHAVGNEFEVLSPYLLNLRDLEEWLAGKGLRMVGNWVW